ncbi:MAG: hypothetical protein CMK06_10380 [Ponticaulis sp.]|nr:hypothetical protein [Ponticaulis sp.]
MSETNTLRLLAVDQDDLNVISAACQDGVCKPSDLILEGKRRRFRLEFNRFRWEVDGIARQKGLQRVRSVLSFEDVSSVKARGMPPKSADLVLSVLSIDWQPDEDPPGGEVRIVFAGHGEIVISADCLDATLIDVSQPWATRNRPAHKE